MYGDSVCCVELIQTVPVLPTACGRAVASVEAACERKGAYSCSSEAARHSGNGAAAWTRWAAELSTAMTGQSSHTLHACDLYRRRALCEISVARSTRVHRAQRLTGLPSIQAARRTTSAYCALQRLCIIACSAAQRSLAPLRRHPSLCTRLLSHLIPPHFSLAEPPQ